MKNKGFKNQVMICLFSTIVYFVCTYPLRDLFAVFTVTDVRPGAAFNPFLSICFGPAASLGCSFATLLADYLSGYPTKVLIQGFPFQFLYGFIPYLVWKKLTKGDDHSYRIDSLSKYLKFTLMAFIFGILSGLGVAYIVYSNFGANFVETIGFVFMNNFTFTMLLGFPLMIFANITISGYGKDKTRKLSISEHVIIYSSIAEFVGIAVITFATYSIYSNIEATTYDLWNNIFIYSVIYVNIMIVLTILVLNFINKRQIKKDA